jgi:hypothetical protein
VYIYYFRNRFRYQMADINLNTKTRKDSKADKALQYFTPVHNCANKSHKCNLCEKFLLAKKTSNLVPHLKFCHKQIYDIISTPQNDEKYYLKKRLKFIQNCAEIVAINGRPFTYLNDSGFLKFIENDLNELIEAGYGVDLRDKVEIKMYISELAEKIKNKIKSEVSSRYVSVMVDIGSKNGRSLMGISVQYLLNGSVSVRCLGTIELKTSHTAVYIKEVISNCLSTYDISIDQVFSITTDNGSNVLAMVDLFNGTYHELERFNESISIAISEDSVSFSCKFWVLSKIH